MNDDLFLSELKSQLGLLLEAHGHKVSQYKDWLILNNSLPAFQCSIYHSPDWHPAVFQVDFSVLVAEKSIVYESFAILGSGKEQVREVLEKFSRRALHVILEAVFQDGRHMDQVEVDTWGNSDVGLWRTVIGPWLLETFDGEHQDPTLPDITIVLKPLAEKRFTEGAIHWCRCFYSNLPPAGVIESLWDNEPWGEATQGVQKLDWPGQPFTAGCFIMMSKLD